MQYRIKPGYTFRDSDDKIKGSGDQIELSDDVAKANVEKIEPIEEPAARVHTRAQDQDE